jgi:putative phosphoribosyl transferase
MQPPGAEPAEHLRCTVSAGNVELDADVFAPRGAHGLVIFAHGSSSSRHSPRNRYVSGILNRGGLNTMLIDLLTAEEEQIDSDHGALRFNIPLLGSRLTAIGDWVMQQPRLQEMPLGYFGASTGAAAALVAASLRPAVIGAVVSRGGRPDLASLSLERMITPTLFIVGGDDVEVIALKKSPWFKTYLKTAPEGASIL